MDDATPARIRAQMKRLLDLATELGRVASAAESAAFFGNDEAVRTASERVIELAARYDQAYAQLLAIDTRPPAQRFR